MSKNKKGLVYETRVLYRQTYMSEDDIQVVSATHAVMWDTTVSADPVTSRLRTTMLFKKENGLISPIQGLIEQWKGEGWTPLDEFCDAELVFEFSDDFEEHLMRMARSFLLGIPLNGNVNITDDTPPEPVEAIIIKPEERIKGVKKVKPAKKNKSKNTDDSNFEESKYEETSSDDDDDDWL
jgi:hypothetical protein